MQVIKCLDQLQELIPASVFARGDLSFVFPCRSCIEPFEDIWNSLTLSKNPPLLALNAD